ncbi:hypothetical protein BDF20DRAFT_837247 [Mycotypha africana]|uniref:uncharacterized protein n=1 Tax=Mycotypha africana TaxID=64632 RepID=UPI0023012D5C|nr:uncharacterized protein BDF20DRAFT_837247 [Mycotypha africana]KAI8973289.1 hypothetical protein BDF20DRAFT_837247 [Mycotypha africana]
MDDNGGSNIEQNINGKNSTEVKAESNSINNVQQQQQIDVVSIKAEETSASTSASTASNSPVTTVSTPVSNPVSVSSSSSAQIGPITVPTPTSFVSNANTLAPSPAVASPRLPQAITPRPPPTSQLQTSKPLQQPSPQSHSPATTSQPSSMTLLDNLTSQLSPDRKEKFLELFRKLQNNAVSVPDFLSQARMLLDQQQYQQIENLKNKPSQQQGQQQQQQRPRNVPSRPPTIQPQQQIPQLQPISSSQVRAEDAQRAMMPGFINAQQGKKFKASDIPKSLPIFRPNNVAQGAPQLTLQQQQFLQQQQMKQHLLHQHLMQQQRLQMQAQSAKQSKKSTTQQQQQQAPPLNTTANATKPQQELDEVKKEVVEETTKQPTITQNFMNREMLKDKLTKYTSSNHLELEPDVITLIALATEKRLERLLKHMIEAFKHRTESQTFTQPPVDEKTGHHPFKIVDVQDIKKQLLAIERVEREEERKRKEIILEKERKAQLGEDGAHDGGDGSGSQGTGGGGGGGGDDGDRPKKKKKKEMGPSVSARYMSDDVRNKTTNETALMIAGGVMKSWMLTGMNSSAPSPSSFSSSREKLSTTPISRQSSNSANMAAAAIKPEYTNDSPNLLPQHQASNNLPTTTINANDAAIQQDDQSQQQQHPQQQPSRGRGRPRRRKSGSGPDGTSGKKMKGFPRLAGDGGLFLPPSTIGRPHRLGEQATRKITKNMKTICLMRVGHY